MDHVAFSTDNIVALRRYLSDKGFKPSQIQGKSDHSLSFTMKDPDGHPIEFVERSKEESTTPPSAAVSHRMIHAGFLVYNRSAEDHFYLDILGFRPYWHGGMKDTDSDWVAIQVPDGTEWLEYMFSTVESIPPINFDSFCRLDQRDFASSKVINSRLYLQFARLKRVANDR